MAVEVQTIDEVRLETPRLYRVILLNDDITTFDFVIWLLQEVFGKGYNDAVELTFQIDREGSGVAGVYPKEVAETKQEQVHTLARQAGYPLRAVLEEE